MALYLDLDELLLPLSILIACRAVNTDMVGPLFVLFVWGGADVTVGANVAFLGNQAHPARIPFAFALQRNLLA